MHYQVRKAVSEDLGRIEEIYAYARKFMAEHGNPNQWGKTEPPHDQLVQDIHDGTLHVVMQNNTIHGVFFFWIGEDPTYGYMENGNWSSNTPYGTIHRIAGDGSGGILKTAIAFAQNPIGHLRIDTHEDNFIMQNALDKLEFQSRGIIYLPDGSPRIAYERIRE